MADLSKYKAWDGKERVSATAWNEIIDAIKEGLGRVGVGDIRTHIGATGISIGGPYPAPSDYPTIYPVRLYCGHWRPTAGTDFNPGSWNYTLDPEGAQPIIVFAAIIGDARGRYLPFGSPVVVLETCGQYWCFPIEPLLYHFRLDDCLFPGSYATAYLLFDGAEIPGPVVVYDRLGLFTGSAGDRGVCFWDYANNTYSIIFMNGLSCSSSSSDSSTSDSSTSDSSTSDSSMSDSSMSDSSMSDSSMSESSTSESSTSESSASESWPPESSKSTAIVPVSFTETGYAALFIHEMPEVRFDDVIVAKVRLRDTDVPIDQRFIEVCHPNTIEVCGVSCNMPVAVGATVVGNAVKLRFSTKSARKEARVVIRLTGIRKGFRGQRFPSRTRNQFEANERFINSAYGAE